MLEEKFTTHYGALKSFIIPKITNTAPKKNVWALPPRAKNGIPSRSNIFSFGVLFSKVFFNSRRPTKIVRAVTE